MTTFIDKDTGAEWEETPGVVQNAHNRVIRPVKGDLDEDVVTVLDNYPIEYIEDYLKNRPIKQQPKFEVDLQNDGNIRISHDLPEDQAQLIKEAVMELMEYVTGGTDWTPDFDKLSEARQSMRENN